MSHNDAGRGHSIASIKEPKWPPPFENQPLFDTEVSLEDLEKMNQRKLDEDKAARRRQQHKEVVARSRLRQRASAAAIQQQEMVLSNHLHRLLDQSGHSVTPGPVVKLPNCHEMDELRHKFAEQVAVQERIRLENKDLQTRIEQHAKLCDSIEKECVRSEISKNHSGGVKEVECLQSETNTSGSSSWIFFEADEQPIYYVPMSEEKCENVTHAVFQRMLKLHSEFIQRRMPVSELEFFGWRVMRPLNVDPRLLRFQFTKTLRIVDDSMDAIVNRTWDAFHDPKTFATIYSTPVVTRVIQRVSDDMSVLVQNAPVQSGEQRNIRYFNILARVRGVNAQKERVVALLKTIVSPSDCQRVGVENAPQLYDIEWMKRGISYLLLTEELLANGERNIRLHYGCDYQCVSEEHARFLMVEVLGIACRWEQLILPSHRLIF